MADLQTTDPILGNLLSPVPSQFRTVGVLNDPCARLRVKTHVDLPPRRRPPHSIRPIVEGDLPRLTHQPHPAALSQIAGDRFHGKERGFLARLIRTRTHPQRRVTRQPTAPSYARIDLALHLHHP